MTDPGLVGVQFKVPVQVATGVKEPLLTGVHVPEAEPRLESPILKSKFTEGGWSSHVGPASLKAKVAVRTWFVPT